MKFDNVKFAKFSVDPEQIFRSLPQYQTFWPIDWSIVCVSKDAISYDQDIKKWLDTQAVGKTDLIAVPNGDFMVAFEDKSDAVLFKISINGAV